MKRGVAAAVLLVVACSHGVKQGIYGRVAHGEWDAFVADVVICAAPPEVPELVDSWAPDGGVACARSGKDGRFVLELDGGPYRLCQVLDGTEPWRLPCDCEVITVGPGLALERNRSLHPVGGDWYGPNVPACIARDREVVEQFDVRRYGGYRDAGRPK